MRLERLVQCYHVIEWRDNAVYKTQYMGDTWVGFDDKPPPNELWVPMPTDYSGPTVRRVR